MSLILDALRKLERERDANEPPGVLVVGSVPWGETSRVRRLAIVAGAAAVLALAVAAGWMLRPVPNAPALVAPSVTPAPVEMRPTATPPPPTPTLPSATLPPEPPAPAIRLSRPPPASQSRPTPSAEPAGPASTAAAATSAPPAAEPDTRDGLAPSREHISLTPGAAEAAPPPAPPADELRLNAISQRDGRPVALINDRLVFEGDSFDGVRVIRIGETEVEVEVKGQRRVLRF